MHARNINYRDMQGFLQATRVETLDLWTVDVELVVMLVMPINPEISELDIYWASLYHQDANYGPQFSIFWSKT
jgi:hypothetical protein